MENFHSIDWRKEANRLEIAFDINQPCEFVYYPEANFRLLQVRNSDPILPDGLLKVGYTEAGRNFTLIHSMKFPMLASGLHIDWNGNVHAQVHSNTSGNSIAQGLFCLNLLIDEAEVTLKTAISAHEKLEWLEAYEKRLALHEAKRNKAKFGIPKLLSRIRNFRK